MFLQAHAIVVLCGDIDMFVCLRVIWWQWHVYVLYSDSDMFVFYVVTVTCLQGYYDAISWINLWQILVGRLERLHYKCYCLGQGGACKYRNHIDFIPPPPHPTPPHPTPPHPTPPHPTPPHPTPPHPTPLIWTYYHWTLTEPQRLGGVTSGKHPHGWQHLTASRDVLKDASKPPRSLTADIPFTYWVVAI